MEYLIKNGAPFDSLGTQAHGGIVGTRTSNGAYGVWKFYDELYARYKKTLQYTELDIALKRPDDPVQQAWQADRLRDSMMIAFAHPAVTEIFQWGYWEGSVWLPGASLWNKDWSIKPAGQAYIDLVHKTWWTNADGQSNTRGEYSTRGFLGDYEIIVTANGKTKTVKMALPEEGRTLQVVLN